MAVKLTWAFASRQVRGPLVKRLTSLALGAAAPDGMSARWGRTRRAKDGSGGRAVIGCWLVIGNSALSVKVGDGQPLAPVNVVETRRASSPYAHRKQVRRVSWEGPPDEAKRGVFMALCML